MKQIKPFLMHIMDEIKYLLQDSENLGYEEFIDNEALKRSFVRSFEIIGEAAKNLPNDFRNKHPEVQWKEMAGFRDVLIHRYFQVNYRSVWDVVKNKIPDLKEQIEKILNELKSSDET